REVVDASASERNRAGEARRLDAHARRGCERGVPAHSLRRHGPALGGRLWRRSRGWRGLRDRAGGLLREGGRLLPTRLLLLLLILLLLPHRRPAEIPLPHDQHERGQHDGEDGVLLVTHLGTRSRRSARLKSSVICANGSDKAARRPIST